MDLVGERLDERAGEARMAHGDGAQDRGGLGREAVSGPTPPTSTSRL
jgi:hypothetical protein